MFRFLILFLSLALPAKTWAEALPKESKIIRVLTYGSMTRKGAWGEFLAAEFARAHPGSDIQFITTDENAGLLGRLRADHRRRAKLRYDVVLGLENNQYHAALSEGLVTSGKVFDRSPFSIIADTQKFPASRWPRKWSELKLRMPHQLLIPDPRLSGPGAGLLRVVFQFQWISLADLRATVANVFPSWSAAYGAFSQGRGLAVWSFLSSVAYHRCAEKSDRYQAIPLAEGYPVHEEWVAGVARKSASAEQFMTFVLSEPIQQKLPEMNWMYPVSDKVALPNCFPKMNSIKGVSNPMEPTGAEMQKWLDTWSL